MAEWTQAQIKAAKGAVPFAWSEIEWEHFCDLAARGLAATDDETIAELRQQLDEARVETRNALFSLASCNATANALEAALRLFRKASMGESRPMRGESSIGWQRGDGTDAHSAMKAAREALALCPTKTGESDG